MKGMMLGMGMLTLMAGCSVNYRPEVREAVYSLERENKCFVAEPEVQKASFDPAKGVLADKADGKLVVSTGMYIALNRDQRQQELKRGVVALHGGAVCR